MENKEIYHHLRELEGYHKEMSIDKSYEHNKVLFDKINSKWNEFSELTDKLRRVECKAHSILKECSEVNDPEKDRKEKDFKILITIMRILVIGDKPVLLSEVMSRAKELDYFEKYNWGKINKYKFETARTNEERRIELLKIIK